MTLTVTISITLFISYLNIVFKSIKPQIMVKSEENLDAQLSYIRQRLNFYAQNPKIEVKRLIVSHILINFEGKYGILCQL